MSGCATRLFCAYKCICLSTFKTSPEVVVKDTVWLPEDSSGGKSVVLPTSTGIPAAVGVFAVVEVVSEGAVSTC